VCEIPVRVRLDWNVGGVRVVDAVATGWRGQLVRVRLDGITRTVRGPAGRCRGAVRSGVQPRLTVVSQEVRAVWWQALLAIAGGLVLVYLVLLVVLWRSSRANPDAVTMREVPRIPAGR